MRPPTGIEAARPLVITGMHRSGTSLLASLCAGAGVHVGARLIGASRGNDRGHWEDLDFYEFHARVLESNGVAPEGFACIEGLRVPADMRDDAAALVAAKAAAGVPWGWKDPRTCLFLDFWHGVVPEAVYVFVFRSPWEVADSLFRRGDPIFVRHPALAVRVWHHYNRHIVDFCLAHRPRCVLVEVTRLAADPAAVFADVRDRLGVPVGEPPARFEEPLLVRDDGRRRREIVAALQPEAVALYGEMRRLAGGTDAGWTAGSHTGAAALAEHAIGEWATAATSAAEVRAARAAHAAAESEARAAAEAEAAAATRASHAAEARAADLDREKRAAEGRLREVQALNDELAAQVQRLTLGNAIAPAEERQAA